MDIKEERLVELEKLGPGASHLFKAELSELIVAYRSRIKGLTVTKKEDGVWLNFTSDTGKSAVVHADTLASDRGRITGAAIADWAKAI